MAAAEGFMGVVVILVETISGAGAAGTVVVGTDAVGMGVDTVAAGTVEGMGVGGTGAVGMAVVHIGMVLPTGGGVTHIRMPTDLMVGSSERKT